MKIKTFFIDVGGVLVRTESTSARRAWEQKLHLLPRQLTKEISKIQPAKEATVGLVSAAKIWQNVAKKYSLNNSDLEQLKKDFFAGEESNQEFQSYVSSLRKNYKVALFTNAWDDARDVYTNKYHLDTICDQMIISAEQGLRKPHKKFYYRALELMKTTPAESIYIDDRLENIKAGREIGFHSILFKTTEQTIGDIEAYLLQ